MGNEESASEWLTGERVLLAPLTPDSYPFIYHLATAESTGYRWRYRGSIPPYDVFVQQIHIDVLSQFIVRDRADSSPIGHVLAYGADLRSRVAFVANIVRPSSIGALYGAESQVLFINFLFNMWDFRKLYIEVPDFTYRVIAAHIDPSLFRVEGRLTEHSYYGGRYWDQVILAVTRDRWTESVQGSWTRTRARATQGSATPTIARGTASPATKPSDTIS